MHQLSIHQIGAGSEIAGRKQLVLSSQHPHHSPFRSFSCRFVLVAAGGQQVPFQSAFPLSGLFCDSIKFNLIHYLKNDAFPNEG